MSRTLSESTVFQSVAETALAIAGTTGWRAHQPNQITKFGASIKKITRDPLGNFRQRAKGDVVDLEAPTEWTADLTKDLADQFIEGLLMSATKHGGGTGLAQFSPTAVASGAFAVPASGALQQGTLVYGRGFTNAPNNGLLLVAAASTNISIKVTAAVPEAAPPLGSMLEVAGFQGAASDITIDASQNLASTIADFTTMGLNVGQWIWIGGGTAAAPGLFGYATAADRGFARIGSIAAHSLVLVRRSQAFSLDAGAAKTIQLFFSRWLRNTSAQNADYKETSYTFETTYATLSAGAAEFEYAQGCYLSDMIFDMPTGDKVTTDLKFVGASTIDPSTTRLTGASVATPPVAQAIVNTSVDMARLRVANTDETGLSTDIRNLKVTLSNNVSREVVLGTLGARFMNVGTFDVMIEGEFLFTNEQVVVAVRDNRTISVDIALRNGDFCMLFDVPAATIDSTDRKFNINESVTLAVKSSGFQDPTLAYTTSISLFSFVPAT